MICPCTSPLVPSSTGEDTSLLSKALRDISGAISLKDERMGHYLATWVLSYPWRTAFLNEHAHVAKLWPILPVIWCLCARLPGVLGQKLKKIKNTQNVLQMVVSAA